jgi:hypothetical protein
VVFVDESIFTDRTHINSAFSIKGIHCHREDARSKIVDYHLVLAVTRIDTPFKTIVKLQGSLKVYPSAWLDHAEVLQGLDAGGQEGTQHQGSKAHFD